MIGYVKKVCVFCFAVVVVDWCLNVMLGQVVIGYVKKVCVFGLQLLLLIGV